MRTGFVQTKPTFGDKAGNIERALALIERAEAELLVLPELFATGYFFPNRQSVAQLAEPVPDGPTVRIFRSLARQKRCAFVFGLAEKAGSRCYNSAVYVTSRGAVHLYRKLHLFYRERVWFSEGNLAPQAFAFHRFKLGLMICFDWRFPEVCRILALKGAHLICHPANLVHPYCQLVMRGRSLENRVFTVTANRVGRDVQGRSEFIFTGRSQVTDPDGRVLVAARGARAEVEVVDLDLKQAANKFATPVNHLLKDRRPRFYRALAGPSR